jgi:hypothetical protein
MFRAIGLVMVGVVLVAFAQAAGLAAEAPGSRSASAVFGQRVMSS